MKMMCMFIMARGGVLVGLHGDSSAFMMGSADERLGNSILQTAMLVQMIDGFFDNARTALECFGIMPVI